MNSVKLDQRFLKAGIPENIGNDAAEKLENCEGGVQHSRRLGSYVMGAEKRGKAGQEQQLQKICKDTNKIANEQLKGISTQVSIALTQSIKSCCCLRN